MGNDNHLFPSSAKLTDLQQRVFVYILKNNGICCSTDLLHEFEREFRTIPEYHLYMPLILRRLKERGLLQENGGQEKENEYRKDAVVGKHERCYQIPTSIFLESVLKYL